MQNKQTRFQQFIKWMKGNVKLYTLSVFVLITLQYFRSLTPLFFQHIVDYTLSDKQSRLPSFLFDMVQGSTLKESLFLVGVAFLGLALIRVLLMFIRRFINALFTERIVYNMRNKLYNKIQNLTFSYHTHVETGDLIQRCTTDVETYRVFIGEQFIEIIRLTFLVGFSIYNMLLINVKMTIVAIMITPIIFIAAIVYFNYVKKVFKEVEEAEAKMTTTLQESVTGIRVVKAFAKEEYEINKFKTHSEDYLKKDFKLLKLMSFFWSGTDFLIFTQYALTLSLGIYFATQGEIEKGEFIAFLSYVGMIVWPLRQLGRIVGDFGKTTVALDRIDEIMLQKSEHEDDSENQPEIFGNVEFKNVGFKFEDDHKQLLKDISFTVNKGESIAIVGKTGSGKSTLINLMIRLLENQDGQILFEGVDIKNINKHHLRKNIGIIMQEPFLYSRSLYDNIRIIDKKATDDRVFKAASIASLHDDILGFEQGYQTLVGERGVTLSGGQKQRVAIARMLLDSKPVLIFDDSLSAVDTETDIQIRNALQKYWKDTTVFIITHRITSAMEADKIIVLDKGVVAEMGTHNELLQQNGIYKGLWDIQSTVEDQFNKQEEGGE